MDKLKLVIPSSEHKEEEINYIKEFYTYHSKINGIGGLHRYLDCYNILAQFLRYFSLANQDIQPSFITSSFSDITCCPYFFDL